MKLKMDQYDGFVDLAVKPDGTYLIVYAPNDGGKKVTLEEAISFLKERDIKDYNIDAVKEAINSNKEREEKKIVGDFSAHEQSEDEEIAIEISKNKMFAVISFIEPKSGGKLLTKDDILQQLNKKGIVYGIDLKTLDKILADKKYNYKYIIAKGTEVINGKNGTLKFNFDVEKKMIKPKIADDGTIDFKNLDLIEIVKKGQVLVTALPPKEGRPGKDIFGKVIPNIVGKNAVLPQGKNVVVDGDNLIADIDGQITYLNNKISIYSTYEVPANVDNSTGNIDFVGNVIVRGNVITGFSIKAGGSIEVYGVVEGAILEADDNIILYRGMQGINRGVLKAGGNITAKYIENSDITAGGDIQANAIMHSNVKAGGFISLEGKKGLLVGGIVRSAIEINAKTIGSPMATVTEIEVGIDPNIIERFKALKEEVTGLESEHKKVNQLVNSLVQMKNKAKLTDEKEQMLEKYTKTEKFLKNKLEANKSELEVLDLKIQDRNDGRVKAYNVIYPGVKLTIGSIFTYVREEVKYCCAVVDNAEIKFNSYS